MSLFSGIVSSLCLLSLHLTFIFSCYLSLSLLIFVLPPHRSRLERVFFLAVSSLHLRSLHLTFVGSCWLSVLLLIFALSPSPVWTQTSFLGPVSSLHFCTLHLAFVFSCYWSVSLLIFALSPSPQGIQSTHYLTHSPASAFLPRLALVFFFSHYCSWSSYHPLHCSKHQRFKFLWPSVTHFFPPSCGSLFLTLSGYHCLFSYHALPQ